MRKIFDRSVLPGAPDVSLEAALCTNGLNIIAGLDEAGRGAWAGPVAAAAVVLPADDTGIQEGLKGVRDSKELSPEKRCQLACKIKAQAYAWAVAFADNGEIDELGILPATRLAMMRAVTLLKLEPGHLLIDALFLPDLEVGQTSLIKGDQRSLSIAAASILAKTERDALMVEMCGSYQAYRFDRHKGYGTALHRRELAFAGVSEFHRKTFRPMVSM